MTEKRTIIILIGFIVALTFYLTAIAATDAPHNASNNISCGSCHGETIMESPFWGTGTYDELCLSCHRRSTGGPYSQTDAPAVTTHSDSSESALAECRDCHNPHYQRQKVYKNTDANNLYLATGKILSCEYSDKDPLTNKDISTFHYSDDPLTPIKYKSGTGWDATKLPKKTEDYRGAILFPHVNKLGYNYPITAVNPTAKTITVNGNLTTECNLFSSATFAVMYGQYIKDNIVVDGTNKQVKFFDQTGTNSFADGDSTYNGVCEVCHTQTTHFRYGGGVPEQNHENICEGVRTNCIRCHKHKNGFGHGGGGGEVNCEECHGHENDWTGGPYSGTTLSHSTHTENDPDDVRGPFLVCINCHNNDLFPCFKSGVDSNGDGAYNLSETNVCDGCHSPGGAFNGVISVGGVSIGAKTNWKDGVYQADNTLTPGKEKWCAGCHDDEPSVVDETAPDICSDNSEIYSYTAPGYYRGAHGDETYGVNRQGVGYSKGACVHCHAPDNISATSSHGGQLFAAMNPTSQTDNFCFQCHKGAGSVQVGGITNNDYGSTFGGGTANSTNIKDAFASGYTGDGEVGGSSHNLNYVRTWWRSRPRGDWVTTNTNACVVCHPPHYAHKNHDPYTTYKTAIRRPVDPSPTGNNAPRNLWGDETGSDLGNEMTGGIGEYTTQYQAPYRVSKITYEPVGDLTQDGSNLPNFVNFCNGCHTNSIPDNRTDANVLFGLVAIEWGTHKHGTITGSGSDEGDLIAPYTTQPDSYNHVLSCTDCHEPHGSPNPFLLRTCVNGKDNISVQISSGGSDWDDLALYNFCIACHVVYLKDTTPPSPVTGFHGSITMASAPTYRCTQCHGHWSGAF